jgi:hypothetical protein
MLAAQTEALHRRKNCCAGYKDPLGGPLYKLLRVVTMMLNIGHLEPVFSLERLYFRKTNKVNPVQWI